MGAHRTALENPATCGSPLAHLSSQVCHQCCPHITRLPYSLLPFVHHGETYQKRQVRSHAPLTIRLLERRDIFVGLHHRRVGTDQQAVFNQIQLVFFVAISQDLPVVGVPCPIGADPCVQVCCDSCLTRVPPERRSMYLDHGLCTKMSVPQDERAHNRCGRKSLLVTTGLYLVGFRVDCLVLKNTILQLYPLLC